MKVQITLTSVLLTVTLFLPVAAQNSRKIIRYGQPAQTGIGQYANPPGTYIGGGTIGRSADLQAGGKPGVSNFGLPKTQFNPLTGMPGDKLSREGPSRNTGAQSQSQNSNSGSGSFGLPTVIHGPNCPRPGDAMRSDLGNSPLGTGKLVRKRTQAVFKQQAQRAQQPVYSYGSENKSDPYNPYGQVNKSGARQF